MLKGHAYSTGTKVTTINGVTSSNIFIAKHNGDTGSLIWETILGGDSPNDVGNSIIVFNGSLFVCGAFASDLLVLPDGSIRVNNGTGTEDAFLMKMDTAGNIQWLKTIGGTGVVFANKLVKQNNLVCVTGNFAGTFSQAGLTAQSVGQTDIWVGKFSTANGTLNLLTQVGGTGVENAKGIVADTLGNVWVGGSFSNSIVFGGTVATITATGGAGGETDCLLFKLNNAGQVQWARGFGSADAEFITDLARLATGELIVVGNYQQSFSLDGFTFSEPGSVLGGFVLKVNFTTGGLHLAHRFG